MQFTHIVDFMIMMPLGPQFMRLFDDRSAAVRLAGVGVHVRRGGKRLRRRVLDRPLRPQARAARAVRRASSSRPRCADSRPSYSLLLAARIVAGIFGGVIGALVFAIVADLVPYARRARRRRPSSPRRSRWPRCRRAARPVVRRALLVARAVSRARRVQRAGRRHRRVRGWCRRFDAHVAGGERRRPLAQLRRDLRRAQSPARVRLHDRAHVRGVHGGPVHRRVQRRQRRRRRGRAAVHLFRRRRSPRSSPRRSSAGSPTATARSACSRSSRCISIVPILVDDAPAAAAARLGRRAVGAVLRVRAGPLRPGDGARHRQRRAAAARQLHELQRVDPAARAGARRSRPGSSSAARPTAR